MIALLPACRSKSIEYVGKAGKSLGAYAEVLASSGSTCEIQKGRRTCEAELLRPPWQPEPDEAGSDAKPANVYATDEIIRKSVAMLATYGAALEKLSGKSSVGTSDFVGGVVTLNGKTEWVDLGKTGPDAIKAGAKILDRIIAGSIQRKVFRKEYDKLAGPMAALERTYHRVVKGQLLFACQVEQQIANNQENLEALTCDHSPDPNCASIRQLSLVNARELRSRLRRHRQALYRSAEGMSVFFAAHAKLGKLLGSNASDSEVLEQMKGAAKEAKKQTKAALEQAERDDNCPYRAPDPPTATAASPTTVDSSQARPAARPGSSPSE